MWQFDTMVSEVVPRTQQISSFRFPIKSDGVVYSPGQFFFVTIKINGQNAIHHFSFSSSPTEKGYLEFTKRITTHEFSQVLAALQPGDWANLRGPMGNFTLPSQKHKLAFLSGGIGITPIRSMLRFLADSQQTWDIVLLYGNSGYEEIAFRDELTELSAQNPGLRIEHVLSDPELPPGWQGRRGHINTDLIRLTIPDFGDRFFYLSGPPKMVTSLEDQLSALEIPPEKIRRDSFTGYD